MKLDMTKSVFQIHGADWQDRATPNKGLRRRRLNELPARLRFVHVGHRGDTGCSLLGTNAVPVLPAESCELIAFPAVGDSINTRMGMEKGRMASLRLLISSIYIGITIWRLLL